MNREGLDVDDYCDGSCANGQPCPKPPSAPELPEGWTIIRAESPEPLYGFSGWTVPLSDLRALLASQGLEVIPTAELEALRAKGR